jgi:diguanylate cyclase (GGDEF)-like protein
LNIFEGFKDSIEKAKHGDFTGKLHTKLKNELQTIVENYNIFLSQLNTNFDLITKNLNILIPHLPASKDRLIAVQKNMEILGDINKFKKIIEEDASVAEINNRIIDILEHKFNLKNFKLYGVINSEQKIELVYQKGESCCEVTEPHICRAYRTSHEINSVKFPNICQEHNCPNMNYICIPFSTGGAFTGVLSINLNKEEYEKHKELIPYIESYLNESASIMEAKYTLDLMKQSSLTDQLTGLYNRRYLDEILEKIAASSIREKSMLGILMIDIDYFKKVNDSLGHDAGDIVLKQLSQILVNNVRDSDFVVRFGGEEFIIVLQNIKNEEGIVQVAQKIRQTFENTKISVNGKTLQKTISVGISIFPLHTNKIWECIKFSDLALYEAKRTGRNKVVIFNEHLLEEADYKKS